PVRRRADGRLRPLVRLRLYRTEGRTEPHEAGDPPRIRQERRAMLVREHVRDALDQPGDPRGAVLAMPPVLHGQAEAGGRRRPGRTLPAPLREVAGLGRPCPTAPAATTTTEGRRSSRA